MKNPNRAILFDLDGTLLDTAPDLHLAMLKTLQAVGRDTIAFEHFLPHVHTGTTSMIKGSTGIDETDPEFPTIRQIFLQHYENQIHIKTDYFPGMLAVLDHLDKQEIIWGIVTNKPAFLTDLLLSSFGLDQRSHCVISGDTLPRKKPHPDQLLHACESLNVSPKQSVYIGDAESDVIAAKAAGMIAIGVLYGYHGADNQPSNWGADQLVAEPQDIISVIF